MEPRSILVSIKSNLVNMIDVYKAYLTETDVGELNYILDMINYCLFVPEDLDRVKLTYIEVEGYSNEISVNPKVRQKFEAEFTDILLKLSDFMESLGI